MIFVLHVNMHQLMESDFQFSITLAKL